MHKQLNFETFTTEQQAHNYLHTKYIPNDITSLSQFTINEPSNV